MKFSVKDAAGIFNIFVFSFFNLILITCYKTFFGKIFFISTIFAFSLPITKVENKKNPLLLPMLNFLEGFKKRGK